MKRSTLYFYFTVLNLFLGLGCAAAWHRWSGGVGSFIIAFGYAIAAVRASAGYARLSWRLKT